MTLNERIATLVAVRRRGIEDRRPGRRWTAALRGGAGLLAAAAAVSTGPFLAAAPARAASISSVSYWQQQFDAGSASLWSTSVAQSRSGDSWDLYNLAYGIDAYTAMYEATGATKYLDRALTLANNEMATAKPSSQLGTRAYRDSYVGWVSQRSDVKGQEVPLFESYGWRYVGRLLRVIRFSPAYASGTYRPQYDKLLAFTENNVFAKWYARGANANIYRSRTHMASHWAYLAVDLAAVTTDATRRSRYDSVFDNINRHLPNYSSSLRKQLVPSTSGTSRWFWSDVWGSTSHPGQDVAHGNGVVAYVVEARDLGREWTRADLARFVGTLGTSVWPREGVNAAYVDGSGSGTGWFADGFVKLGRYDAALQVRLQTHAVRNQAYAAAMAVNARILTTGATVAGPVAP